MSVLGRFLLNRLSLFVAAVSLSCVLTTGLQADIQPYSQDFEGLNAASPTALTDDGWLVFGNVFDAEGNFLYDYGAAPFPAPNGGPAFSSIASGDGGLAQGEQYLNVYSDYANVDHGNGLYIEALVFQEQTIGAGDIGKRISLAFDYRENPSNTNDGDSQTFAFIRVLRQSDASFTELGSIEFETTSAPDWLSQVIQIEVDDLWSGELLQFGFRSYATDFNDTGRFYDNIQLLDGSVPSVTVTVDPSEEWLGFMSVFDLNRETSPPSPAGFVFGSPWGFEDLTASFDAGGCLTLGVNSVDDPNEFWYIGGGGPGALGNKWMDANSYVQYSDDPSISGVQVTFVGTVKENTFTANHTARAFIRDFAPDFSSFQESSVELTDGELSVSLLTQEGAGRHVQIGFNVQGENVWITDASEFGNIVLGGLAAPLPSLVKSAVYHNGFSGEGSPPWNAIDGVKSLAKRLESPVELSFDNLINTSFGINGIILDIDGLEDLEDLDFEFLWSGQLLTANSEIENWESAPQPSSISLHSGEGEGGSDRVLITWPAGSIQDRYLGVQVNFGSASLAELFIGHLRGETTGLADGLYTVAFSDITPIRSAVGQNVDAGSIVDIDKNGTVSFADISAMRSSIGSQLPNITIPAL